MSKREILAIVVLLIVGFVAYEVIRGFNAVAPDEVAPGEAPQLTGKADETPDQEAMQALVPAVRVDELYAAVAERHPLPALPAEAGGLAVPGNDGELFFTRQHPGRAEVCVMRSAGIEVLWITHRDQIVEIVGAHGPELLLKFVDRRFDDPADAWQPGGFYRLDIFATGNGPYPADLDEATVEDMRLLIRR